MSDSDWPALAERILADLRENPPSLEVLAADTAARTDPWRWYCRLCGSKGDAAEPEARDEAARAHLRETPCGRHEVTGWAAAGRLPSLYRRASTSPVRTSGSGATCLTRITPDWT